MLFDAVEKRLDIQVGLVKQIDDRVATSFGVASTILPVTVGLLNLRATDLEIVGELLLVAAFIAYGAVIVSTFVAYHQRTLSFRPNIEDLARNAGVGLPERDFTPVGGADPEPGLPYSGDALHVWVALERAESIKHNQSVLKAKSTWGKWSIRALFTEAILLSLAALVTVF